MTQPMVDEDPHVALHKAGGKVIPLSALQQRDVAQLLAEQKLIQDRLNVIARTVIAGSDLDPDALIGWAIDITRPSQGIVLRPPAGLHLANE